MNKENEKRDYLFYDWGEGKIIEKIPLVADAYDWEEIQLIPLLKEFDIFSISRTDNYLKKGNQQMMFIRDVIDQYGSIKFGKTLEIGVIQLTKEEFERLKEF